ncbi:MAG: hypothetical protein IT432_16760 [Phycisphaerales bacterium]|nr:hypothetical protein [Phycisphaerales bacterium]
MLLIRNRLAAMVAVSVVGVVAGVIAVAGPLNPPAGAVSSTYKTLSEVEPRIAINSTNTPGGAGETFLISQPGSYYLTGNITMTSGKQAIGVSVNDVTIDLNGYTITGVSGAGYGVVGYGGVGRIVVRNGSFRAGPLASISVGPDSLVENVTASQTSTSVDAMYVGDRSVVRNCRVSTAGGAVVPGNQCVVEGLSAVNVNTGVHAPSKTDVVVRDCVLVQSGSGYGVSGLHRLVVSRTQMQGFVIGVSGGDQSVVEDCRISNGTIGLISGKSSTLRHIEVLTMASAGVQVSEGSTLEHVDVRSCTDIGINVTNDCVLTRCNVSGSVANGIVAISRNTFVECISAKNTAGSGFVVSDSNIFETCRADENTGDGFNGRFGNVWRDSTARANTGDGIEGSSGTVVLSGRFDTNGNGATVGANIRLTGDAGRIEGNTLISGDFGIQTTSGGNVIIRNSSRNSANSYGGISAGNDVGPIGSAATATSPWANIQY